MSCKILSSVLDQVPSQRAVTIHPPPHVLLPQSATLWPAQWIKDVVVAALSDTKLHRDPTAQGEIPGIIPGHPDLSPH